jgi:chemotaxis protein histidine kinase CheA
MSHASREVVTFSCGHAMSWEPPANRRRKAGCIMNLIKQRDAAEPNKPADGEIEGNIRELVRRDSTNLRQVATESELPANNLSSLLRRVAANSTREIDNLIGELQTLRERLHADGSRVEREIVEYAALSQSVIQLTKIIADGVTHVKKLPDIPGFSE